MKTKDPCGCIQDDGHWLSLCEVHADEWNEIHQRWDREHGWGSGAPVRAFLATVEPSKTATVTPECAAFIDPAGTLERAGLVTIQEELF